MCKGPEVEKGLAWLETSRRHMELKQSERTGEKHKRSWREGAEAKSLRAVSLDFILNAKGKVTG